MPDIPTQNLFNTLMQIYQATANTAGPYANLYGNLAGTYGAQGLGNYQGAIFGYNGGAPAAPPGGFYGQPATPAAPGLVGPVPQGTQPGGGSAGTILPDGSVAPPGFNPYNTGSSSLYSPPEGTLIGLGPDRPFNDPYAGSTPPSQSGGYQPGVADINTTALGAYGPAATAALFQANPYLQNSLDAGQLALLDSSMPLQSSPLLNDLNQFGEGLDFSGALSPEAARNATQGALASLGQGGMTHGNTGIAVDLLSRDAAVTQRQNQAIAQAMGIQGLNFTQQGQELQRIGMAGNLANQTTANVASSLTNPIFGLLGLNSGLEQNANPNTAIAGANAIFNPFTQLGTDVTGFNANANANSSIANANQNAAFWSGIMNLGGNLATGLAGSDERLKKGVKKTGKSPSGIPKYRFKYKTDKSGREYEGTTAQALEKAGRGDAVLTDPISGLKAVNYGVIDVDFNPYSKLRRAA